MNSPPRVLRVPALALVVLVGPSGAGKSTFAARHFAPTEVVSSDAFRAAVCDDPADQTASADAFDLVHGVVEKRLARGRFTVVDATNVEPAARRPLLALARRFHCPAVAVVFDLPEAVCAERSAARVDCPVDPLVVQAQRRELERSRRSLRDEGFGQVHELGAEEVDSTVVVRVPLACDRRREPGPFDLVGDVHGCLDELCALLGQLGYGVERGRAGDSGLRFDVRPPAGRRIVFLGDLVDRGPDSPSVLRLVMDACAAGAALCVPGNHDVKLRKRLRGGDVVVSHGLAETLEQFEREPAGFAERVATFLEGLPTHLVLDGGRLVAAHAGLKASLQGRSSRRVRDFALYGQTTGETDAYGLPVRQLWAADYTGSAHVVYGHTPVHRPEWLNRTICIDTGCVFGGRLTALRWPERELVSVPAARTHYEPLRPFLPHHGPAAD